MKKFSFLLLAGLFASTQVAAEIYKCTDARGKIQYGDKPCEGESVIFTPREGPKVDDNIEQRREKTHRLLRAYQEDHAQKTKKAAEMKAEEETRQKNCRRAMNHQRKITSGMRMRRVDKDGNQFDLTDEERAASEASARADMKKWCD